MSKLFNLLLLHSSTDIHPRSWVCLNGPKIKTILKKLEKNVLKNKNYTKEKLNNKLSVSLNCSPSTIRQILQGKRKYYPIPIILELIQLSDNKKEFLKKLKQNIEFLKINSASAKPIKAVYKLSENLAKILGAFMADGSLSAQQIIASKEQQNLLQVENRLVKLNIKHSKINYIKSRRQYSMNIQINQNNLKALRSLRLPSSFFIQTHYNIEITEEYKDSVKAFIKWVKEEFEVQPTFFKKIKNAWRVCFSNKILARYLMIFFNVAPGPKTYFAFEPQNIKKSSLKIRKCFAKGVITFDGCVTVDKKIVLSLKSKKLINAIKTIWQKDILDIGISENQKRGEVTLFTTATNKNSKLEQYIENNTQKWKLLKWLEGDLSQKPRIKHDSSAASVNAFLKIIKKGGSCDTLFLSKHFQCCPHTARTYLKILKHQKKIILSNTPIKISDLVSLDTMVLLKQPIHKTIFTNIREKFKTDKNFSDFLNIKKATLSAWRLRKNRIPLHILKKICAVLNIDFQEVCRNVKQTDREIAEIIL